MYNADFMNVKAKHKKSMLFAENYYGLKNELLSMFKYTNVDFRPEFLENILQRDGMAGLAWIGGKLYCGSISWNEFDDYGLPIGKATFITPSGKTNKQVEIGKDCVICYNNAIRTPNLDILHYANLFTEVDTSLKNIISKTRLIPIPVVNNNNQATVLNAVMKNIDDGELKTILQDDIFNELDGRDIKTIELTKPEEISNAQYISKLYDDVLRRIWTKYGHMLSSASKMAQVNSKELEGYETYSRINPYIMLHERQIAFEEVNRLFGTNITVDFNTPWEHLKVEPITEEYTLDNVDVNTIESNVAEETVVDTDSEVDDTTSKVAAKEVNEDEA